MSATAAAIQRRTIRYNSLAEILDDAERLASGKFRTLGNWSFGQILEHMARSMNCSIDGFGFQAPWFARKLIAPFVKNSFMTKTMRAGFKLPESGKALIPPSPVSVETGLEHLRQAFRRFDRELRRAPHPLFGPLASQEWVSIHQRHAELHMSFVVLDEGS